MLIIFSGLPGTGKTTLANQLARRINAMYLRIDTLEHALVQTGLVSDINTLGPAGYQIGHVLAADNLRLGMDVIADSVNPLKITRDGWRQVALDSGQNYLEIEIICSDQEAHRRRVETRKSDLEGFTLPDWQAVITRNYEPWDREHLLLDTACLSPHEAVNSIIEAYEQRRIMP